MDRRGIAIRAGLVAPPIALVGILLATLVDPDFTWLDSALSHTGELPPGRSISLSLIADRPSFLLFNGSLIVAGLGGLPFAWLLHDDATHPLQRSGAITLTVALVSLAAVGVFHLPHGWHAPSAIVHFLSTMGFLWLYGLGMAQVGDVRRGAVTALLGTIVLATWLLWTFALPDAGIAIPEFVGALALGGWILVEAFRKLEERERDAARAGLGNAQ
ncbi:hypothetical protein L593_00935 [Salinarchaeum sp. Harcht-Bsk1]|uniref:DUF998 domain-containing protein n=1 Tax=Salinarchaeum sp. Harcht-Bsk1 TaxID=1333523 RepID=UPI0003423AE6|nr:DUF998 domain-containing protein [Salinarchaeum sp. Harcht-Bsk1]AGN00142.1 hypothetical protein L593_00935 [Salinarchaeum sp. Harcht-Bsk1]